MCEALRHRGPDGHGVWEDRNAPLVFGHRRLAILDLSPTGRQPMESRSGRWVITYNGEIYNYKELSSQLQGIGWSFSGRSDTEVLLAALEEWGIEESLSRIEGMFAFALWDAAARRLVLARDRAGEKPLFVARTRLGLAFASEVRAFEVLPDWDKTLDPQSVALFLRYGYLPGTECIYEDAYRLAPGSWYAIDSDILSPGALATSSLFRRLISSSSRRYWPSRTRVPESSSDSRNVVASKNDSLNELEAVLRRAVRRQIVADVPVGAFLSGGIDSSLIASLMTDESSKVQTFSISFDDANYDESRYSKAVADALGTDHHVRPVDAREMQQVIAGLHDVMDEPIGNPSIVPVYLLAKMTREHVTVALSGDGADELFGGYNRYGWGSRSATLGAALSPLVRRGAGAGLEWLAKVLPNSILNRAMAGARGSRRAPMQDAAGKLARAGQVLREQDPASAYLRLIAAWHDPSVALQGKFGQDGYFGSLADLIRDAGWVDGAMSWDFAHYLPGDNLAKVDRATMAASLEVRAPFLDVGVLDIASRIRNAFGGGSLVRDPKWPLKDLLRRRLPADLVDRPKMGFSVPIARWLKGGLRDWADELLTPTSLNATGMLDPRPIQHLWQLHRRGMSDESRRLWPILVLQQWFLRPVN
jgi:asparagine synthase (glutamine-hydrolysing)